ncbi:hypothetical protein THAOC_21934, partial [Thalassiosira oceanica]
MSRLSPCVGISYSEGIVSELEKSQEKANEMLPKAANLGHALANSKLADCYQKGADGFETDPDEAYFRASVAFALDIKNKNAANILGGLHFNKHQILAESSPYLACYYRNVAASQDPTGAASYLYGQSLLLLAKHFHGDNITDGFESVPAAAFFWMRKSLDLGCEDARKVLERWEAYGQSLCANCSKKAETGKKYK